ncbi:hypothetical protein KDL01_07330 [Actinospica durhamensis]|uniref:Uncharacterized protein n=1 Tax=Actinospica durhamensis TaxID=1508375 RepID=A0A941IMN9_9ACTN|nr:hypothetical protein [Actinospica durhamensis]MBR7833069.1 hypothetical protein [Actinospica durhamensis]
MSYDQHVEPGAAGAQGPNARAYVTNYYGAEPPYELVGGDEAGGGDAAWLRRQPSRLLDARNAIVPFRGRVEELGLLAEWRDHAAAERHHLVHAHGGQGKSRLAARFAAQCVELGWTVLHAR